MSDNEDDTPEEQEFNFGKTEKENGFSEKQEFDLDGADYEEGSPNEHEGYLDETYEEDDSSENKELDINETENEELYIPPIPINEDEEPPDSLEASKKNPKLVLLILLIVLIAGYGAYRFLLPSPSDDKQASVQMSPTTKNVVKQPAPIEKKPLERTIEKEKKIAQIIVPEPVKKPQYAKPSIKKAINPEHNLVDKQFNETPPSKQSTPELITPAINKKVKVVNASLPVENKKGYFLQAGVFIFRENANSVKKSIEALGYSPEIKVGSKSVKMSRVTVGNWIDIKHAEAISKKLNNEGYSTKILKHDDATFTVMVGSYYYKKTAAEEIIILTAKGYDSEIVIVPIDMKAYHVLLGPYNTIDEVASLNVDLKGNEIQAVIIQSIQ